MAENDKNKSWFADKLWKTVSGFFTAMFESTWAGSDQMFSGVLTKGFNLFRKDMDKYTEKDWKEMLGMFLKEGMVDDKSIDEIAKLRKMGAPFNTIMYFVVMGTLAKTWLQTTIYGTSSDLIRSINSKYSPNLPSPGDVIHAGFIAPEKINDIRKILKDSGLSDKHIDLMFLANYRLYDETTIMILWLRGVLDDGKMFMRMREIGYTDTRTKEIMKSWSIIPGPSDLFHLVAREAFEPDAIELMGLGDEFPEEQTPWLEKQGISKYWAEKYWCAHWDQPSIQQGFEMLHRNVIKLPELNMLFKTVEIPPYWRDKLIKIAYMPYTRVDVRRMHKVGVLNDEQLLRSYMDLGYDVKHATEMSNFTKIYNMGAEKNLSKSEILKGFKEGILSLDETKTNLTNLGYSSDEADYYISYEEYKESKSIQEEKIKIIAAQYKKNIIDDFEARKRLDFLDLPSKETNLLLDRWKVNKVSNTKLPTKEDLGKFVMGGIITPEIYYEEMQKIGYPEKYITWYIQLLVSK